MLPTPAQARAPRPPPRSADAEDIDDRAERLITGSNSLFNRFRRIRTITGTGFPLGIEIRNDSFGFDSAAVVGLTWDDAELLELPEQRLQPGDTLGIEVKTKRGVVLEVWADDNDVVATPVAASSLAGRAKEREERQKEADEPIKIPDPFEAIGDFLKANAVLGLVALVVVGVVVVQVSKQWDGSVSVSAL